MTDGDKLTLLKLDLQLMTDTLDKYLQQLLESAGQMIAREGITLIDSPEDTQLLVMYAAYLYRKRAEDSGPMPRMLRWALNNRLFAEKVRPCDAT